MKPLLLSILFCFILNASAEQTASDQKPIRHDSDRLTPILSAAERQYIATSKILTVCSVAQAAGSEASFDLVALLTRHTGLHLRASPRLSWEQGLASLQSGKCDILPWATPTKERASVMSFTKPYARIIRVIVTRQGQPYINDINLYNGELFVAEKGNNIVTQLKKIYPNINIIRAQQTSQALDLVADKTAFASIASLYSIGNLFNQRSSTELKIAGRLPAVFDDIVSLATRKQDGILHGILEKAVLTTNPTIVNEFMNRGAVFSYQPEVDYSKYWMISALALILFAGLIWWNRYLSTLNNQLQTAHALLEEKSRQLEQLSITDPLTGTYNRIKIDNIFSRELSRVERYSHPLSIIMIDIDYFKNVNDNFGHLIGDQVLIRLTSLLKERIRTSDLLGRWGGEEFLIICPSTELADVKLVAEKLRASIESADFSPVKELTASFGVAEWQTLDTEEMMVSKADTALYQSKHSGRNRVSG